jgi:DNA-binding HxlR family transcriptional regulator
MKYFTRDYKVLAPSLRLFAARCILALLNMSKQVAYCPIYAATELLQEKWVLHIIRSLLKEPKGFNELSRDIGGCNSNTLAERLEQLEQLKLVHKSVLSTMPPRTHYELTASGAELNEVTEAIERWGLKHLSKPLSH